MLKQIKYLEDNNVKTKIKEVADESIKSLNTFISNPAEKDNLHKASFNSALQGLRTGVMTYENDTVLPMFVGELTARTTALKELTIEQYNYIFMVK